MAGNFTRKTAADNVQFGRLSSSGYVEIDGGKATPLPATGATKPKVVGRVVISQKGLAFIVKNGSRTVFNAATTTPEGSYQVGAYCENGLSVESVSGSGFAIVTFD